MALIAGEPGVGKSRLVHELTAVLPASARVLVGQADPGALGRPFELLLDALDGAEPDAAAGLQAIIADPAVGPVERLRAGLDGGARQPTRTWSSSRTCTGPTRRASRSSSASATCPAGRLLLGTYRPGEVNRRNPAADLLTRLERRYPVTYMRLERLSLDDTSALLTAMTGRPPPYRAAVALQNRTGGNPFFLEELVKAAGGGDLDLRKLSMDPLPWNLADTLRRQLDELDHTQERVIEAAAVLGRKVPFDLLAAVTGLAEDDLIEVLRELVRRGLLVEMGDDEFGFRHALAREAISDQLLGRQRRRLHELAFETLVAAENADLALIAHHAKGAGRYDDMVAAVRRGVQKYLQMGSSYQALQLAEMGLAEVLRRSGAADRRGPVGLAGGAVRRRQPVREAQPAGRRHAAGALRRVADAGARRLGDRPARRDGRADRPAHRDRSRRCPTTPSGPPRPLRWPSRTCSATTSAAAIEWADRALALPARSSTCRRSGWRRWWRRARRWSTTRAPPTPAGRCCARWPTRRRRPASGCSPRAR